VKINLANTLTMIRIAAIPAVVLCFYSPLDFARPLAGIVFGLAAVTDILDGYVARKLGQTSKFGEFLDPVADKLMVTIILVLLVAGDPRITVALIAVIIIGREITVSALREWMASIGARGDVAVKLSGKVKTVLQMFGIGFMVYEHDLFGINIYDTGYILLLISAGMTLWSMVDYLRAAWPSIAKNT
jgi:CDP-diacylglycerol--glycerol-3-phosphate 3-phosphatidyltransferase/cardiolipin synthase